MLGRVRGEACDGTGLVMVLEEDGGPAVRGWANKILRARNSAFEVRECPVFGCGLELVGSLANVDDVLVGNNLA